MRAHRSRVEDRLQKKKHQAANENTDAALIYLTKFELGHWAWVYRDHNTITGGGKHVRKSAEGSSVRKTFALISKKIGTSLDWSVQGVRRGTREDG